jgi:hypothetical protein
MLMATVESIDYGNALPDILLLGAEGAEHRRPE